MSSRHNNAARPRARDARRIAAVLALFAACASLSPAASGQDDVGLVRIAPVTNEIAARPGERLTLTLQSGHPSGVFVSASIFRRDADGTLTPAEGAFAIAPPQGRIDRGRTLRVDMEWASAPPAAGEVYAVFFDELPLGGRDGASGDMHLTVSMGAIVVAQPEGSAPERLAVTPLETGGPVWRVRVENPGDHVLVLSQGEFAGAGRAWSAGTMLDANADTYLYPRQTREFLVPAPVGASDADLTWRRVPQ